MIKNKVRDKIKQGKPSIGVLSNLPSEHLTELFGIAGYEFIIFDMEHSAMTEETLESLARVAKSQDMVPMVRVRENDPRLVMGALDAGCLGIMFPQIESDHEARIAIDSTKYRPQGSRGINWKTVAGEWGRLNPEEYINSANENILNLIQIETKKGYENVETIVATEGIDLMIIGPSDLSGSMGYPGHPNHEDVKTAIERIEKVSRDSGIPLADSGVTNEDSIKKCLEKGVLLFIVNPVGIILESCMRPVTTFKSLCE